MTRASRLVLISLGILAIGSLGGAPAQVVEQPAQQLRPVNPGPPGGGSQAVTDLVPPAPQPGPHTHYKTLLTTLSVPADQATYGDFCDFGYWAGGSYAGHDALPAGYWVYMSPSWFIYKDSIPDAAGLPVAPRPWGPEQATGAPDTWPKSGDLTTAWASQTPDGQREWLELTYDAPIRPTAVLIYETFNPGAVDHITGYNADGKEFDLWTGSDPTPVGSEKGISVIALHPEVDVTRIRVYLDSQRVAGWNEIDAVGLLDAAGTTHWAKSASASSTYADVTGQTIELQGGQIDRLLESTKNEIPSPETPYKRVPDKERSSGERHHK